MAKTIDQIQTLIDSQSLDARQLVNLIADYLQANPGGGGGITIYTGDGALEGNRIVYLDGHSLDFVEDLNSYLRLWPSSSLVSFNPYDLDDGASGEIKVQSDLSINEVKFILNVSSGISPDVNITGDGQANAITYTANTHTFNGKIINPDLVAADFADDTAAGVGGIAVGGFYHTAGVVKVRLA